MSKIEQNTAALQSILAAVNALPEAGGGLPDGISVLASGTVTIASDSTYETITHNLGVIPSFIMWAIEDDVSAEVLTSFAVCGSSFTKGVGTSIVQYLVRGFGSTGSAAGTTGGTSSTVYMTATQARMVAHNSYKLKAGYTYHWVCGVMDGVEG